MQWQRMTLLYPVTLSPWNYFHYAHYAGSIPIPVPMWTKVPEPGASLQTRVFQVEVHQLFYSVERGHWTAGRDWRYRNKVATSESVVSFPAGFSRGRDISNWYTATEIPDTGLLRLRIDCDMLWSNGLFGCFSDVGLCELVILLHVGTNSVV